MRLIAGLLVFLMLTPLALQFSVLTWYQVNRGYISEVLCINRDLPEMQCDGKCVLAQKLKQAEREKQNELPALPEVEISLSVFIVDKVSEILRSGLLTGQLAWGETEDHYAFDLIKGLFHPPPAI